MSQCADVAPRDTLVETHPATAPSSARPQRSLAPHWRAPPVLLAVTLILFARRPDAFLHPQFWAEDSVRFFLEADQFGGRAILRPFAGYLHFLPRLIAAIGVQLDPEWTPAGFNAGALLGLLWVAARCLSPRLHLPIAPLWALALVLVPHTGEVFMTICNLQWIACLALLQWLIMDPPGSRREALADGLCIVLVGLTGPFILAFLPLFALRCWRDRSRASVLAFALGVVCAAVQLRLILQEPSSADPHPLRWLELAANLSYRLVLSTIAGPNLPLLLPVWLRPLAGGVLLGWLASRFLQPGHRWTRFVLWGAVITLLASAAFRARIDLWAPYDYANGDRYFYGAKVLLLWLIALELMRPVRQRLAIAALLALILLANAGHFRLSAQPNLHWRSYAAQIRAGQEVDVPVNPGWNMHYPGKPK